MSQFWHNLCCRNCDPGEGPCPECPGSRKVPVTWTGSFTLEGLCCEDPVNYPDYPCFPHQLCNVWELPETTIGPIDFILEPFDNSSGLGEPCAWRGTSCHAIPISACTICDCPAQTDTLWVCVKLELYCVGGNQSAILSVRYSYGEECQCDIETSAFWWSASYYRTSFPYCNPYCPEDFECNEEWHPYAYSGNAPVWGGGTLNCNRFGGSPSPPALATRDYGTLIWKLAC